MEKYYLTQRGDKHIIEKCGKDFLVTDSYEIALFVLNVMNHRFKEEEKNARRAI